MTQVLKKVKNQLDYVLTKIHSDQIPVEVKQVIQDLRKYVAESLSDLALKIEGRQNSSSMIEEIMSNCNLKSRYPHQFANPFDLKEEDLKPELFAESLARIHRFWTQTDLTVAEHSVNLANLMQREFPENKALAQWALFHELYESYTGDLATPYKKCLPEYKVFENRALAMFAKMNGLPEEMPFEVHLADKRMMYTEALVYMHEDDKEFWLEKAKEEGMKDFGFPLIPYPADILDKVPLEKRDAVVAFAKKWIELDLPITEELQSIANRPSLSEELASLITQHDQYTNSYEMR